MPNVWKNGCSKKTKIRAHVGKFFLLRGSGISLCTLLPPFIRCYSDVLFTTLKEAQEIPACRVRQGKKRVEEVEEEIRWKKTKTIFRASVWPKVCENVDLRH